jgi:hypothetical protein
MAPEIPNKLQGYTMEQWQAIIDGGYLCEIADEDGEWYNSIVRLSAVDPNKSEFSIVGEKHYIWAYARPAQIPGVLRPWFGGECPVDPDTLVFVKFRSGAYNVMGAGVFDWGQGPDYVNTTEIIAYMEIN